MKIFKKIFSFLKRSKPSEKKDECFLKIISVDDLNIDIDFEFDESNATNIANVIYQLDTGILIPVILGAIYHQSLLKHKEKAYDIFISSLGTLSSTHEELIQQNNDQPVIKPDQVFRHTSEHPNVH